MGTEVQLSSINADWVLAWARFLGHKEAEVLKSSQLQVLEEEMEEAREQEGGAMGTASMGERVGWRVLKPRNRTID